MVTVVNPVPHPSVVKEVICRNCGVTLSYVPNDVASRIETDYGGGSEQVKFIKCPSCKGEVQVKGY
jgi:RNase P subunit RPR2